MPSCGSARTAAHPPRTLTHMRSGTGRTTMATNAEKRAWLRDQGHEPPARGPLPPHLNTLAEEALAPPDDLSDLDWDLGDDGATADPDDMEPSVPMQPERPPRTAR